MDEWVDGWMDGWVDGWVIGWIDGWMDGWMDVCTCVAIVCTTCRHMYVQVGGEGKIINKLIVL